MTKIALNYNVSLLIGGKLTRAEVLAALAPQAALERMLAQGPVWAFEPTAKAATTNAMKIFILVLILLI